MSLHSAAPKFISLTATSLALLLMAIGCQDASRPAAVAITSPTSSEKVAAETTSSSPVAHAELAIPAKTEEPAAKIEPTTIVAAQPATELASPTDSKPTAGSAKPAQSKRAPIYLEEPNGKELIAAALKKAKRDHKHVIVEWGGNWCGWCYKLHDVFHKDETVAPIVHQEFELVLIDCGPNEELMKEYGGKDRQYSYPHLTVLDDEGKVLTNQETGSLEEGDHHVPKLVNDFLSKWVPEKIDAEKLLSDSLAKATSENKKVIVRVGDPYCGWCKVLAQFMQDHEALFATDYIDIKIDTMRMSSGKEVAAKYDPANGKGGVPWMVILSGDGKTLATSIGPEGNIGHPYQSAEIAHFITMLRETRQKLSDDDLKKIEADLNAYREQQEAKKQSNKTPVQ